MPSPASSTTRQAKPHRFGGSEVAGKLPARSGAEDIGRRRDDRIGAVAIVRGGQHQAATGRCGRVDQARDLGGRRMRAASAGMRAPRAVAAAWTKPRHGRTVAFRLRTYAARGRRSSPPASPPCLGDHLSRSRLGRGSRRPRRARSARRRSMARHELGAGAPAGSPARRCLARQRLSRHAWPHVLLTGRTRRAMVWRCRRAPLAGCLGGAAARRQHRPRQPRPARAITVGRDVCIDASARRGEVRSRPAASRRVAVIDHAVRRSHPACSRTARRPARGDRPPSPARS